MTRSASATLAALTMFSALHSAAATKPRAVFNHLECSFKNGVTVQTLEKLRTDSDPNLNRRLRVQTRLGYLQRNFSAELKTLEVGTPSVIELSDEFSATYYLMKLDLDPSAQDKQTAKGKVYRKASRTDSDPAFVTDAECTAQVLAIPQYENGSFLIPISSGKDAELAELSYHSRDFLKYAGERVNKRVYVYSYPRLNTLRDRKEAIFHIYGKTQGPHYNDLAETFCGSQSPSLKPVPNSVGLTSDRIRDAHFYVELDLNEDGLWTAKSTGPSQDWTPNSFQCFSGL